MTTVDQMIDSLKAQVAAAREEFDIATVFHSVWKPAAYDEDLHRRMGPSRASNAFLTIRNALQREMLLALMRIWDRNRDAVRMSSIGNILKDARVIDAIVDAKVSKMAAAIGTTAGLKDSVFATLGPQVSEAIALIDTHDSDDEIRKLKFLRDKVLAHRQVEKAEIPEKTASGPYIERFVADMSRLIKLLMSIAHATSYDPVETGEIYERHAEFFWASAKGERTEGHPNYRPPLSHDTATPSGDSTALPHIGP